MAALTTRPSGRCALSAAIGISVCFAAVSASCDPDPFLVHPEPGEFAVRYVRGHEFRDDWIGFVEPNAGNLMDVLDALGPDYRDEFIDGEHWLVYEYEETTIEYATDGFAEAYRTRVRGKRLRIKFGGSRDSMILGWVFEEWSPRHREVTSSDHWYTSGMSDSSLERPGQAARSRDGVIDDALQTLRAARVQGCDVIKEMINSALKVEGFASLSEEEAGDYCRDNR